MRRHATRALIPLGLALVLALAGAPAAAGQSTNRDPRAARLVVDDIARFWQAWDRLGRARTRADSLRSVFEQYYLPASPGLVDFIKSRIGSEYDLLETLSARAAFYRSIRPATLGVSGLTPTLRHDLERFAARYPEAVFPDVYFLIGRLSSGGTTSDAGLLIGTEMISRTPATVTSELNDWERAVIRSRDGIRCLVAHELMHYQQHLAEDQSLLAQSLGEGSADFVAELVCGGNINARVHEWALPREAELWKEFTAEMSGRGNQRWLYGGANLKDRPADLGYFIGYRIAQAYYRQATDSTRALHDIFNIQDFPAFLRQSGYDPR